jgi:hypothetical protein
LHNKPILIANLSGMKRLGLTAVLVIVIVILLGGIGISLNKNGSLSLGNGATIKDSGNNISDYSAVFLTNGQVYFGQLKALAEQEVVLTDIYYLQVNQASQLDAGKDKAAAAAASPDIQLIKLGSELHGPNDKMRISRNQVLFTESLKNDSKVVAAIKNNKK